MPVINRPSRQLLRAASLIHEQLVARDRALTDICLPEDQWREATRLMRQIEQAQHRGWPRAAAELASSLRRDLEDLCHHLTAQVETLRRPLAGRTVAGEAEIYRDLVALGEEFEGLECDFGKHEVCVTTVPIVLEGYYLGPFQIRLDWRQLQATSAYRVVAMEPHPAESNDSVTHPHVSEERVCEGDGRRAIRTALDEGRLADFFMIVAQLLATYAPGQAFVELDNWEGTPCHDCGGHVYEDDRSYCESCDELLCSGCVHCCGQCDTGYCSRCVSRCDACSGAYCESCLEQCADCAAIRCESCLTEGLCQECVDQANKESNDDDETITPATTNPHAAVQPAGLGQAPVSAGRGRQRGGRVRDQRPR